MAKSPERHAKSEAWTEVFYEVQLAEWRETLEKHAGNITRAAKALGFVKSHGMRLTKRHGLNGYAAELRMKAIGYSHGRPRDGVKKATK